MQEFGEQIRLNGIEVLHSLGSGGETLQTQQVFMQQGIFMLLSR
jgi:hypothetical protein